MDKLNTPNVKRLKVVNLICIEININIEKFA